MIAIFGYPRGVSLKNFCAMRRKLSGHLRTADWKEWIRDADGERAQYDPSYASYRDIYAAAFE